MKVLFALLVWTRGKTKGRLYRKFICKNVGEQMGYDGHEGMSTCSRSTALYIISICPISSFVSKMND